jgi:putative endonuclease
MTEGRCVRNPDAIIAVYMMASRRNGTLYTGVTSDLQDRVWKHKLGTFKGFTDDYGCKGLVWFEPQLGMTEAIAREKQIKKWRRAWKLELIEAANPVWADLAADWYD